MSSSPNSRDSYNASPKDFDSPSGEVPKSLDLTQEQLQKIEDNKERAKRIRLQRHYEALEAKKQQDSSNIFDTGGGFFAEIEDQSKTTIEPFLEPTLKLPLELNDTCMICDSVELDHQLKQYFRINICIRCREENPDRFSLITKTEAAQDYLLTNEELRDHKVLPCIHRTNPIKSTWSSMQLYLKMHVVKFAIEKWGSLEELETEIQRRNVDTKKRKGQKFTDKLAELRKKTRTDAWTRRRADREHTHDFETIEKDGCSIKRCKTCDFQVSFEEF